MPNLQYNGLITQTVYNNISIKGNNSASVDFVNQQVSWAQGTNSQLIGLKLSDLLNNPLFNLSYSLTVTITGSQYYDDSSYPTTDISIGINGNSPISREYQPSSPGSLGTSNYNVSDNFYVPSFPTGT